MKPLDLGYSSSHRPLGAWGQACPWLVVRKWTFCVHSGGPEPSEKTARAPCPFFPACLAGCHRYALLEAAALTVSNRSKQMSSMGEVAWVEERVLRVVAQRINCAILLAGFAAIITHVGHFGRQSTVGDAFSWGFIRY